MIKSEFMRKLVLAMSTVLFAGASLAASSVATLNVGNGSVLVNQGKQFVTAQPGQILSVGDRVMVMEGGVATVRFADGCVQTLSSGSLAVVGAQSSCASGTSNIAQMSPVNAQAAGESERDCDGDTIPDSRDGDIDGDDILNADDKVESCKAAARSNTGAWVLAGVGVAAAAVAISDGDDETISP
jgi:hypothetical protein